MILKAESSVLVMVDLQARLMPVIDGGAAVLAQAVLAAKLAHLFEVPVIGTEQTPDKLGGNEAQVEQLCQRTLRKTHFNACADGLLDLLPVGRKDAVLVGCEAHVCVLQTACGLLEYGYRVWLVEEAVGSRHQRNRQAALTRLRQEGVRMVSCEMLGFEWAYDSQHPAFRELQRLIK